ncbi:MAG: efflux RND transporter periplasmic adaptor subunit [Halopseudomonas sp.]
MSKGSERYRARLVGMPADLMEQTRQSEKVQDTWTLRSPVDGVVRELSLHEGKILPAGSTMIVINGTDRVWLEVALPEAQAGGVQAGHYVLFDEGTDLYWVRSRAQSGSGSFARKRDALIGARCRKLIEEFIVVDQRLKHEKLHA